MHLFKQRNKGYALFKKFSNKGYAAFSSMNKVVHIGKLMASTSIIVSSAPVFSQNDTADTIQKYDMEEVEVIGEKSPMLFQEMPRLVSVISQEESQRLPSTGISHLLKSASNADIRQRGKGDIQTDISFRGGTFDNTMIMFNGINISDPQTGHLSVILPSGPETIDQIEILSGASARVNGANAYSGAINFVVKPLATDRINVWQEAGSFGYKKLSSEINFSIGSSKHMVYGNYSKSDGHVPNTDYRKYNGFYHGQIPLKQGVLGIMAGRADKKFGAHGFYTPRFPDQFEANTLTFGALTFKTGDKIKVNQNLFWRRHKDRFDLNRLDGHWYKETEDNTVSLDTNKTFTDTVGFKYQNHHRSDVIGYNADVSFRSVAGVTTLGWKSRIEKLLSNNLGETLPKKEAVYGYEGKFYDKSAQRENIDMLFEQAYRHDRFSLIGGFVVNFNSFNDNQANFLPGLDLIVNIYDGLSFMGSYNRTIGYPTFTDLYYSDPGNKGSLDLNPYKAESYEAGLKYYKDWVYAGVTGFYIQGQDIIDWTWKDSVKTFSPINIANQETMGAELLGKFDLENAFSESFPIKNITLTYTYIDKNNSDSVYKYTHARHKASVLAVAEPVKNLYLSVAVHGLDRAGEYISYDFENNNYAFNDYKPYVLTDVRLSYSINMLTVYIDVSNVFDEDYIDVGSIYQPGRWITGGMKFEL